MKSDETIALDPAEFVPEREELGLDELGIRVVDADWGDAEIELFLVRQELGEIPADRHPPNREATIKLRVAEESSSSTNLAEAAERLQKKIGLLQEKGGWVRRDPDSRGEFSTSVAAIVRGASLSGLQGWLMAHRQVAHEVTLKLTIGPYFYGVEEIETASFEESEDRELIYVVSEYKGTAPGIKRVIVSNDNATQDWRAVIAAWESRDYSEANTAALAYEAEDLTLLSGEIKERTGASGKVVRGTLLGIWQAILSSEIDEVGHMTHVGARRLYARVYDPAGELNAREKELRVEYRSLGSTRWTENPGVVVGFSQGYAIIDLGECRVQTAALGGQRWEFRIAGRTNGEAGTTIDIDKIWPLPTEQLIRVTERPQLVTPTDFMSWDEFDQSEGNLNGKALPSGGTWTTVTEGNPDFVVSLGAIKRTSNNDTWYVQAKPPTNKQLIVASTLSWWWSRLPTDNAEAEVLRSHLLWGGGGGTNSTGMIAYYNPALGLSKLNFFGDLFDYEWKAATVYTFTLFIVGGEYAMGWVQEGNTSKKLPTGPPDFVTLDTQWETAQDLEINDIYNGDESVERRYLNFASWIPELDAAVFAERGLELRTDGAFRQHETDDVWGRLTPDGFLPVVSPSLLEAYPTRGIVIPTASDLERLPDNGTNKASVIEKYFPGYHFASEAK